MLCAFACNQEASTTEAIASTSDTSAAAQPAKGTVDFEGPEIDLMKKLISSAEKGDWDAAQSCFADSAVVFANLWPDSTQKGVPILDVLAQEKADRVNWENVSYGDPIYEVVTTPAGEKYGHIWARYTARNVKTKKSVDVTAFLSYLIKDGKLQWEWILYDSRKLE